MICLETTDFITCLDCFKWINLSLSLSLSLYIYIYIDFLKIYERYLHRMTWYTDMCSITTMDLLLYRLDPMVTEIYLYVWPWIRWLLCDSRTMYQWSHGYGFTSSMGYLRSDSIGLLVYDGMCTISGSPVLYYKSLGIALTLPMRG